jgi:hypothetical protein
MPIRLDLIPARAISSPMLRGTTPLMQFKEPF